MAIFRFRASSGSTFLSFRHFDQVHERDTTWQWPWYFSRGPFARNDAPLSVLGLKNKFKINYEKNFSQRCYATMYFLRTGLDSLKLKSQYNTDLSVSGHLSAKNIGLKILFWPNFSCVNVLSENGSTLDNRSFLTNKNFEYILSRQNRDKKYLN